MVDDAASAEGDSSGLRIKELDALKGTWMVCWVDKVVLPHNNSPKLQYFWVELTENFRHRSFGDAIKVPAPQIVKLHLHVGLAPRLPIGTIYQNGQRIAPLPSETVELNLANDPTQPLLCVKAALGEEIAARPKRSVQEEGSNEPEFFRSMELDGYCQRHYHNGGLYILPAYEILRAFYGGNSKALTCVLLGWENNKWSLANKEGTLIREDGSWQIKLPAKIPDMFAAPLANLFHSKFAAICAREVTTQLDITQNPNLYARIPFEASRLRLRVNVQRLRDGFRKFLITEIVGFTWPLSMGCIHVDRDNSGLKGRKQTRINKPSPFGASKMTEREPPTPEVTSEDGPRSRSRTDFLISAGMEWIGLPKRQRVEKEESHLYNPPIKRDLNPLAQVSSGELNGDVQGKALIGSEPVTGHGRFAELVIAMNSLQNHLRFEFGWNVVRPREAAFEGDLKECWRFPRILPGLKGSAWPLNRAAFICAISAADHHLIAIEIQRRGKESGYKAFFGLGSEGGVDINSLLADCALHRGVWPVGKAASHGFVRATARRHLDRADQVENLSAEREQALFRWLLAALEGVIGEPFSSPKKKR